MFLGRILEPEDLLRYVRTQNNPARTQTNCATNIFICNLCNKPFPRKAHARDHVENVHFPETFWYTCDLCDFQLRSRVALRNHIAAAHPKIKHNMKINWFVWIVKQFLNTKVYKNLYVNLLLMQVKYFIEKYFSFKIL